MHTTTTVEGQQTANSATIEEQHTDYGASAERLLRTNRPATVSQQRGSGPTTVRQLIHNTRATDPQETPQRGASEAQ